MRMRCIKTVYWDCWGRLVVAFRPGDIVEVEPRDYPDETISSNLGAAESPYYPGISDIINLDDFVEEKDNAP